MSPSRPQPDALRLMIGPALSDRAYTALREVITDGRYFPGARLTERALAANLGVTLAIHRRDAATAEQVMREHILERAAAIVQAASVQPGLAPPADS